MYKYFGTYHTDHRRRSMHLMQMTMQHAWHFESSGHLATDNAVVALVLHPALLGDASSTPHTTPAWGGCQNVHGGRERSALGRNIDLFSFP
jgi:hypothetical protein